MIEVSNHILINYLDYCLVIGKFDIQLTASVHEWLIQLHLQQYWPKFNDQGLITFEQIIRITWDDLEEIGISKLGHQKKLLTAINKLNRLILSSKINGTAIGYSLQKDIHFIPSSTSSFIPNDTRSSSLVVNYDYLTKLSQYQSNQNDVNKTNEIKNKEYCQQYLKGMNKLLLLLLFHFNKSNLPNL
ncbi:unnamed protein product [Schistosoma mattheei]|uniref:Uncharacterized protein n=1 Tax=Schistosoma mattheei TaxID=31246 RepID=A0A183PRA3_9TREM|nr:unnamed protein product [Schistosoma mattheei]